MDLVRMMLKHAKFMLENWYITDVFAFGSAICFLVAFVSAFTILLKANNGIQREDEEFIKKCESLTYYISLIGYCILAVFNFMLLPYSVPVYADDWTGLTLNRILIWLCPVAIVMLFEYIRDVRRSNWK